MILQGGRFNTVIPGIVLSVIITVIAYLISNISTMPIIPVALFLGVAGNFFIQNHESTLESGLSFSAKTLLEIGIILLGARISLSVFSQLGWPVALLVIGALAALFLFGLFLGKALKRSPEFTILSVGSVAICGASAALAIAAVLPSSEDKDCDLSFTIVSVTVLSTIAMIAYPILTQALGLTEANAGILFGATIHNVAQAVGAGVSISDVTGETATIVKLFRVSLLAPIVILIAVFFRQGNVARTTTKPPLLPLFVIGFLAMVALNSFGIIPNALKPHLKQTADALLVLAIAAIGLKTSLKDVTAMGSSAIWLFLGQTLFLLGFVLAAIYLIP